MKKFKVGVFTEQRTKSLGYMAYTVWYNPAWKGCRVIEVEAKNGTEAKKKAISIAKEQDNG